MLKEHVAMFTVAGDIRNGRPPYDAAKQFQPFMVASSMSAEFKGADNPLRTDMGPDSTMQSMFDLILLRSLWSNTTLGENLT